MKTESPDVAQLAAMLDALRQDLSRLGDRLAALEGRSPAPRPAAEVAPAPPAPVPAAPPAQELSEELVLVLGAAIAAYLGKKAHIRQVRLIGSLPWAQQGRVTIQASHILAGRAGRGQS